MRVRIAAARILRRSTKTMNNRCRVVLILLAGVLASLSGATAFAQGASPPHPDAITIEGVVRNSAGEPVAGATLILEEKGHSSSVETKTKADGTFVFSAVRPGIYTVRAEKSGSLTAITDSLAVSAGEKKSLNLVLETLGSAHPNSSDESSSSRSSPGVMEFKDEPNFTVAGLTDWNNAGTHGSDAHARTSEALAKETLALKSGGAEESSAGASAGASTRREATEAANADNAQAHRLLGDQDERLGDPLGAVREYEQAARLDPSEESYFEWGTELLLHNATQQAVEIFAKGSKAHPDSAKMLAGLGAALYASGSYDEAARRVCDASDLKLADPTPYIFLGKMEQAATVPPPCSEQKLARFVRDQPENALANYYYAIALWKRQRGSADLERLRQAEALLEKAVSINPKFGEAYLQLGILHSARGSFRQAIRAYEKAIEVTPQLGEAHYRLALAYQRIGEESKAQQEFQRYKLVEKTEAKAAERQRRELRQFLIILKDQPAVSTPK